ncbi:MAG TPA: chemotaxis response regulator protein-glutamate methylesterase [Vicinamibacterales bacterium]|nr:chemotaxis response regulator protein-glutamate methylesterase [Vicinamibacterales bacterium]
MKKAKVLVVDDAMLIRRMITDVIASDPSIEVVGDAANGRIALQKIAQLNPDLVTLDVEMPEMNGIQTLKEIRKAHPRLPVIMFSALTERGAADTLEALHHGASDYVTKPANTAGLATAQQRIRDDLVPKIKSLCRLGTAPGHGTKRDGAASSAPRPFALRAVGPAITADIVAVAVSTGGPAALADILSRLPADFPSPIVLVQHMPQMFTRFLAERLNAQTPLAVAEAADGQPLRPGTVYVAPGDYHLTVQKRNGAIVAALDQQPPMHAHRPSADALLRSVADTYGPRGLAVVLTGMGQDGVSGCEAVAHAGGRVIAQDEATSVVWEMAGLVVGAGLADAVLPLSAIAGELQRRTERAVAAGVQR